MNARKADWHTHRRGRRPGPEFRHQNRSLSRSENDCEVIGIRRGWEGLTHVNLDDPASRARYILPLNRENTRTIDRTGGTYLHSTRTNPAKMKTLPPVLEGQNFPSRRSLKTESPLRSMT